jgi:hypothetical protein
MDQTIERQVVVRARDTSATLAWRRACAAAWRAAAPLLLLLLAVALRAFLIWHGWPWLQSDEALLALMGRHILLDGQHPLFFWGQSYLFPAESYLFAGAFAIAGVSALVFRMTLLALTTLFLWLVYRLGRAIYGQGAALLTLLYLALGPFWALFAEIRARGAYLEDMTLGVAFFLLVLRRIHTPATASALPPRNDAPNHPSSRTVPWPFRARIPKAPLQVKISSPWPTYALMGLLAGFGFLIHPIMLVYILPALLVLALARRRELLGRPGLVALAVAVLCCSPLIVYNIIHPGATLIEIWQQNGSGSRATSLLATLAQSSWATLTIGLRIVVSGPECRVVAAPAWAPWLRSDCIPLSRIIVAGGALLVAAMTTQLLWRARRHLKRHGLRMPPGPPTPAFSLMKFPFFAGMSTAGPSAPARSSGLDAVFRNSQDLRPTIVLPSPKRGGGRGERSRRGGGPPTPMSAITRKTGSGPRAGIPPDYLVPFPKGRGTARARSTPDPWGETLLVGLVLATVIPYCLSKSTYQYADTAPRYLLPLYVAAPLFIGRLWWWIKGKPMARRISDEDRNVVLQRPPAGTPEETATSTSAGEEHRTVPWPLRARIRFFQRTNLLARGQRILRPLWRTAAAVMLLALLGWNLFGYAQTAHDALAHPGTYANPMPAQDAQLIAYLEQHHLTRIYADYWVGYRLIFLSNERIIASDVGSDLQLFYNRYPPYAATVRATAHPAYILRTDISSPEEFTAAKTYLPRIGYRRLTTIGDYVVFGYAPGG